MAGEDNLKKHLEKEKAPIHAFQELISSELCTILSPNLSEQDMFVKHECPSNGHFLKIVILILVFDLDFDR